MSFVPKQRLLEAARERLTGAVMAELQPMLDRVNGTIAEHIAKLLDEKAAEIVAAFEDRERRLRVMFSAELPEGEYYVVTRQEAAKALSCSTDTIDALIDRDELTKVQLGPGGRVVIPWQEIRDMVVSAQLKRLDRVAQRKANAVDD